MDTKTCSICKEEKQLSNFHFKKCEGRYNCWCKQCIYYYQKQRWQDRKKKAVELMGGKCCICGYNKNYACLDFHHLDAKEKEFSFSTGRNKSWNKIIEELQKCILVCRNCHGELHFPNCEISKENNHLKDNNFLNGFYPKQIIRENSLLPTGSCLTCKADVFGTKYCSIECAKKGGKDRKVKVEQPLKVKEPTLTGRCPTCQTEVFGTKYCSVKCSGKGNRRVERPSAEELRELIENKSLLAIGRQYGVSDNAVRKWVKSYGLDKET